jgi:pimeloyl-ACP methyl ester carboxylesterase
MTLLTGRTAFLMAAATLALAPRPSTAREPPPAAVDQTLLPYASARDSVRLPDGRRLHMVCMGRGSPVVILNTGAGGWSIGWHVVQPAVAARTRACAWDRAGYGLSTGVAKPQTVDQTTTDLQDALKAGHIAGPYVVVGVSLGGLESLLLADREPSQVVGMVLVDPSFPDESAREHRAAAALMDWDVAHPPPFIPFLAKCATALRAGALRHGGPDPDGCLRAQWPPDYPPQLRAALDKAQAQAAPESIASDMEAMTSGPVLSPLNSKLAIKSDRNYGTMPLIVLTAGGVEGRPDTPADLKAGVASVRAEWRRAHEEIAALSTRGVDRQVPGSPHDITSFRPQLVIDAIDEVVDQAGAGGRIHVAN